MKLSTKQKDDLESIIYFIPIDYKDKPITQEDINMFFEWSDQGKHKDKIKENYFSDGFNILVLGKGRRGLHMRMWEKGMMDETGCLVPYYELLDNVPCPVKDFMKKEMFKGIDAEQIEKVWRVVNHREENNILKYKDTGEKYMLSIRPVETFFTIIKRFLKSHLTL